MNLNNLRMFETLPEYIIMKAPASGCMDCVFTHEDIQTFAGQDGMSIKGHCPICEYRQ